MSYNLINLVETVSLTSLSEKHMQIYINIFIERHHISLFKYLYQMLKYLLY